MLSQSTSSPTAEPPDAELPAPSPTTDSRPLRVPAWAGVALLIAAGALVHLYSLRSHYLLDDYLHAAMVEGTFGVERHPLDLYNFVGDGDRAILRDRGLLPWWSAPDLTIRFFRPLSSALRWADHRLFGNATLPPHLHSFLWWVGAVLAARAFFRRAFSPRVAGIAAVVFALAPCHVIPLAWLANREALVSLMFGTLGLVAYAQWRERGAIGQAALAATFFSLSLLAGEYGLSMAGYVLAYELVARRESIAHRLLGVVPFAAPAAGQLVLRAALGYGAADSGYYSDPTEDPVAFLRTIPRRTATLLLDGWFSLDQHTLTSDTPLWLLVVMALGAAALLAPVWRRVVGRLPDPERRTAGWLLLGSFLALVPVLAVVPSPRLLGASMLGIAATVALVLDAAWFSDAARFSDAAQLSDAARVAPGGAPRRRVAELTGLVALALGFSHLVHGPVTSVLMGRTFMHSTHGFAYHAADLRARLGDPTHSDLVVVRGMGGAFFLPFALEPQPPARFRILAQTDHALVLRRGPRTVDVITSPERGVFPAGEGNLFLDEESTVEVGQVFEAAGMRVTVLAIENGRPHVARFDFDSDLEDAAWINETSRGYVDVEPPALGLGQPFDP